MFTKVDAIVAAKTQLFKNLHEEVTTTIGEMKKEELTQLATIFHIAAKKITKTNSEKQSITSSQYTVQWSVGETPTDQEIKITLTLITQHE